MTGLTRTDLPTSRKVKLAASAFARQAEHGAKTQLARSFGISRPTVYAAASTAEEVLEKHFYEAESGYHPVTVNVDEAQLNRAIVAMRVMAPNSLRPIEDMLPLSVSGNSGFLWQGTAGHRWSGAKGSSLQRTRESFRHRQWRAR